MEPVSRGPALFQRVEALFERVADLPASERARALDDARDPEAAREVRRMLEADAAIGAHLETPAPPPAGVLASSSVEPGQAIAGYRIVRRIGAGGMGVVYEAEQSSPRRRVALKLLRSGLLSEDLMRRFAFESEVLGRLQHPGIAQVFEAGTSASGEPFFAMEFVEGEPLTDHVRHARLDRRQRLELFCQVCDAVQHAHQKGVVHRDLKPSNVLVTRAGRVKVLDFGVARLVDAEVRAATVHTEAGQLIGTLGYMSPEQASGDPTRLDTRSDVYGLGVVLYELLTGQLPIDVAGASLLEALERVRAREPARLGTLDPRLRGDLETIAGKALAKEPEQRYPSAAELGDDVRRHLTDQPINARPPTTFYHLTKFARRNKALVTGAALVVLSLVVALVAITIGLRVAVEQRHLAEAETDRADAERARAEQQAAITAAVNEFMHIDLLAAVTRGTAGDEVTVREVVEAAAASADESFADRPEIAGAVHASIGNIFNALGDYDASERELARAVEMLDASVGPLNEISVYARQDLGELYVLTGRLEEARPLLEDALANAERAFGADDPRTMSAVIALASLERNTGRYPAATAALERVLAAGLSEDHATWVAAETELAALHMELRRHEEALPIYERIVRRRTADLGEEHLATLQARHNVAAALEGLGRYDEAVPIYLRVLEGEAALLGADHPDTLVTRHNLAFVLENMGRFDEAEPLYRETLAGCTEVFGPAHFGTLTCTRSLSSLLAKTGRAEEAVELLRPALAAAEAGLGEEHPLTGELGLSCGRTLLDLGRPDEAAPVLERAIGPLETGYGPASPDALQARAFAARAHLEAGDAARAEPIARAGLEAADADAAADVELTRYLIGVLADAREARGDADEAAELRGRLDEGG